MKISHLKRTQASKSVIQTLGTVVTDGTPIEVDTDSGRYQARRAASCLLECAAGDEVLICVTAENEAFVLAVLERRESGAATISMPGDLNICLPNGKMRLNASSGVALASPHEVSLTSPRFAVSALHGEVTVNDLSFFGARLAARLDTFTLAARMISSTLGAVYEKIGRVFRKVEEIEQIQAGQLDLQARDSLSLHGRHTMMSADQLVKVDGAQIHLG
jgi:hypothetical protein